VDDNWRLPQGRQISGLLRGVVDVWDVKWRRLTGRFGRFATVYRFPVQGSISPRRTEHLVPRTRKRLALNSN